MNVRVSRWPKEVPPLTPEQKAIADDFVHHWHQVLPKRFSIADRFGHTYVARSAAPGFVRTLEIGIGLGEHLAYERLSPQQSSNYHGIDLRENMAERVRAAYPSVHCIVGDCQQRQAFPDGYFDRIIAIHVLEHLPNLPAAVAEMHRLCNSEHGQLQVVIPCEGGVAYGLARKISAQRVFEKRYGISYDWFIQREHINLPGELVDCLEEYFTVSSRTWFPLPIPSATCNLFIGYNLLPKPRSTAPDRTPAASPRT